MTKRRHFLATLGAFAAGVAIDPDELHAATLSANAQWDTSWIDALASAQYRVVFNASEISDGAAMNYAQTFLDHFHDVHGTKDAQTRAVIVFRRQGTPMAFNDDVWNRYRLGEDLKIADPDTRRPALRNVFWRWKENPSPAEAGMQLSALRDRGVISLVCTIAANNWGRSTAKRLGLDAETVSADMRANLVPGAVLVPSGIYALIRAQNAGCAYMPGT